MYVELDRGFDEEKQMEWCQLAAPNGLQINIGRVGTAHLLGWNTTIESADKFVASKVIRDIFKYRHAKIIANLLNGEIRSSTNSQRPLKLEEFSYNPTSYVKVNVATMDKRHIQWEAAGVSRPEANVQMASPDWTELPEAAAAIDQVLDWQSIYLSMQNFYTNSRA